MFRGVAEGLIAVGRLVRTWTIERCTSRSGTLAKARARSGRRAEARARSGTAAVAEARPQSRARALAWAASRAGKATLPLVIVARRSRLPGLVVRCEVLAPRLEALVPWRAGARAEPGARSESLTAGWAPGAIAGAGPETGGVARVRPLAGARGVELPGRWWRPGIVRLPLSPRGTRGVSVPVGRAIVEIRAGTRPEATRPRSTGPRREAAWARAGAKTGTIAAGSGPTGAESTRPWAGEPARPWAGAEAGPVAAGARTRETATGSWTTGAESTRPWAGEPATRPVTAGARAREAATRPVK